MTVVGKTAHEGVQVKTKKLSREKMQERREEDWKILYDLSKSRQKNAKERKKLG